MHRIDTPSATTDKKFTEGSPTGGIPATVVSDDWLNDVQENICKAIELSGITLVKGDATQLYQAILNLAKVSDTAFTMPGHVDFPNGFQLRYLRFSLGASVSTSQSVMFDKAFTNGMLFAIPVPDNAAANQIGVSDFAKGSVTVNKGNGDTVARTGIVIAGGY